MGNRRPRKTRDSSLPIRSYEKLNLVLEKLAVSLLGGIALGLAFLRPELSYLHYVALIPWIILALHPRYMASPLYVLPGSFLSFYMSLGTFSAFHVGLPAAMATIVFWPYVLFPLLMLLVSRVRLPLAIVVPLCWVPVEWLRVQASFHQLEMYFLGSSQDRWTHLIQVADFAGVYGASFLVAAINGAIADFVIPRAGITWRVRLWGVASAATLIVSALAYGAFRLQSPTITTGPRIALVQPNEVHYHDPAKNEDLVNRQMALTQRHVTPDSVELVVWPENAVDDRLNMRPDYIAELIQLAKETRAYVLVGSFTGLGPRAYTTSAYLVSPERVQRYDKTHMIFWAEYMPLERLLAHFPAIRSLHHRLAATMLGHAGMGTPGKEVRVFEARTAHGVARFATPICFEVTSAEFVRTAARRGADFVVNLTSEGVLGIPVYRHMWALSTFRAVENRVTVLRAANNGLSGFIDPNGRRQSVIRGAITGSPVFEPGVLIDTARRDSRRGRTFYSRHGDVFVLACAAMTILLSALPLAARLRKSRALAHPATA